MTTTFQLNANELDKSVIDSIRLLFKDKQITLTVESEIDETEFLFQSEANKEKILQSIRDLREGKGIKVSLSDLA